MGTLKDYPGTCARLTNPVSLNNIRTKQLSRKQIMNMADEAQARTLPESNRDAYSQKIKSSRRGRAVGGATACHISSIAKKNRKANLRRELALTQSTAEFKFHGKIIVEFFFREKMPPSWLPPPFVDDSRFSNVKDKRNRRAPASGETSEAAVVYRTNAQTWEESTFYLAQGRKRGDGCYIGGLSNRIVTDTTGRQ